MKAFESPEIHILNFSEEILTASTVPTNGILDTDILIEY